MQPKQHSPVIRYHNIALSEHSFMAGRLAIVEEVIRFGNLPEPLLTAVKLRRLELMAGLERLS